MALDAAHTESLARRLAALEQQTKGVEGQLVAATKQAEALENQLNDVASIATTIVGEVSDNIQQAILDGEKLEITLEHLYRRLAELALDQAFDPLETAINSAITGLFNSAVPPSRNQQRWR